jgi:2,5-diamino-6-(ribosylamino)-4(3H)-pyrimidinone 5'-phosphate reductase
MDDTMIDEDAGGSPENQDSLLEGLQSQTEGNQNQETQAVTWPVPRHDITELRNPPPYIVSMRQSLFSVTEPIDLKEDEFNRYWPYVDNVWVRQHKAGADKLGKSHVDYYACRLQRPTYVSKKDPDQPDNAPQRNKRTREGGTCSARIKIHRYDGEFVRLTISKNGNNHHSHDLDYIDGIKRNSVVMDIARAEVMKGYMPASVFTVMHEDENKLAAIGGRHINRNDVRNSSQHWRQAFKGELGVHPGYRYDVGNGILPVHIPTNPSSEPASGGQGPQNLPPLPPDTLFFSPSLSQCFIPYLPTNSPVPQGGIPHITLTYATSMDSFLALSPTTPTPISGPVSKAMTHYLRSCHDAILIGVGTAIADNPTLNCRIAGAGGYGGIGWAYHPRPIIIDPSARWNLTHNSKILQAVKQGRGRGPWIVVAPGFVVEQSRVELLKSHGGKYLGLPELDQRYRLSWDSVFRALGEAGIRSIMVEGGGTVINDLLRPENSHMVSTAIVTIAPTYLGTGGVSVCPSRKTDAEGTPIPAVRFQDVRWQPLGEDVVMCGRLNNTWHAGIPDGEQTPGVGTMQPLIDAMALHTPHQPPVIQFAPPITVPLREHEPAGPSNISQDGSVSANVPPAVDEGDSAVDQLEEAAGVSRPGL